MAQKNTRVIEAEQISPAALLELQKGIPLAFLNPKGPRIQGCEFCTGAGCQRHDGICIIDAAAISAEKQTGLNARPTRVIHA